MELLKIMKFYPVPAIHKGVHSNCNLPLSIVYACMLNAQIYVRGLQTAVHDIVNIIIAIKDHAHVVPHHCALYIDSV